MDVDETQSMFPSASAPARGCVGSHRASRNSVPYESATEIDIAVPQARLASLFADPTQNTEWMHDMNRVEPISGELGLRGSRYRLVPKKGDRTFVATVRERRLPSEVDLELDATDVAITTRAFFIPLSADRTRLRHEQVFTFKGIVNRIVGALARRAMRKAQRRHMEAFKQFAEAQQIKGVP
jgi:hypothetical protein